MAEDKKNVTAKEDASKVTKSEKKEKKDKKPSKFSPKSIGNAIARFFKDLRGETKKIVWPSGQMVLKSTGIVLAAIIVIGAGIWVIDLAIAGAVGAVDKAANQTTTEAVTETVSGDEDHEGHEHTVEESTEATTTA